MSKKSNNKKAESQEEIREIVERIQNPEKKEARKDEFVSFYQDYKNTTQYPEKKKSKKIFSILAILMSFSLLAYVGSKYVEEDKTQDPSNIVTIIGNDTKITKEEKVKLTSVDTSLKLEEELQAVEKISQEKESILISKTVTSIEHKEDTQTKLVQKVLTNLETKEKNKIITVQKVPVLFKKEKTTSPVVIAKQEYIPTKTITQKAYYKTIHYKKIEPKKFTVREGDTLVSIAKNFYGNSMDFHRIIQANYKIKSSKTPLHLGQKIIIPRKDGKKRRRFIVVKQGDNLAYISKSVYGTTEKIPTIIQANYKIKNKNSVLHLGQEVYIPRLKFKY